MTCSGLTDLNNLAALHELLIPIEAELVNKQKLKASYEFRKLEIESQLQYAVAFDATLKNDTQRTAILTVNKLASEEWVRITKVDLPEVEASLLSDSFKEKRLRELIQSVIHGQN
jgi:hypothetical protein